MNFIDALLMMRQGKKLKTNLHINPIFINPSFGYCYINAHNGQINSYIFEQADFLSEHWEIVEEKENEVTKKENLNFGEALELLKKDKKLSRACWKNKDIYIYLQKNLIPYHDEEIRVHTIRKIHTAWMPNYTELLADDWMVVQE